MSTDPWQTEAERPKEERVRPELGPVPPVLLLFLGIASALKGGGLVLVAGAVAAGIGGLAAGSLDIPVVTLLGAGGALLRGVAAWGTQVVARNIAIRVKTTLRDGLWNRIAGRDAGEDEGSVAVLATDGLDDLDDYYTTSLPAMIQAAVVPLIVGLRILGADWLSALIIVLTIGLVPLFMVLIGRHTQARTDEALGSLTRLAGHMTELARGLPVLVGLGRVEEQAKALGDVQGEYTRRTRQTLRTAFLSALALELISTISVAIVAVVLGIRLLDRSIGLEPALLALILAPECFNAMRELGSAFHSSQNGLAALQRVRAILKAPRRGDVRGSGLPVVADMTDPVALPITRSTQVQARPRPGFPSLSDIASGKAWKGQPAPLREQPPARVSLQRLTVTYAGREEPTLAKLSADLTGIVAIVGPSGAGKSTLLAALAGSLPTDAHVTGRIAGADERYAAWAPQAPHAFASTPWDELTLYGAKNPDAALRELGLSRVASSSTAELSPGELRRLAVARALARVDAGATLLILDEPTAHLDARSADQVRAAIRRRAERATVVLATHEPETLALAGSEVRVGRPAAEPDPAPAAAPAPRIVASTGPVRSADEQASHPVTRPMKAPTVGIPVITDSIRLVEPAKKAQAAERGPRYRIFTPENVAPAKALWRMIRPSLGVGIGSVLLAFVTIAMGLSLTAVSGWLIVRASAEDHILYLLVAIVGVRFFGIGRAASRYVERLVTHSAAFRVVDALRLRLWRSIAARGAGSRRLLEGGAPVDYLVTLSDQLRDLLPRTFPPIAVGVLSVVGITVTTFLVVPQLTLVVFLALAVAALAGALLANVPERGATRARIRERSALVRGTSTLAVAADELRGNGVVGSALARLDEAGDRLARDERRSAWSAGLGSAAVVLVTSLLAALAPVLAPGAEASLVSVVALLALAAVEPLDGLVDGVHRLPALREVSRRLDPHLDLPEPASRGTGEAPHPVRELALDDLAATYAGRTDPVFSGVSGSVRAGEWLVVEGRSGTGKSTLLSVVMGALPAADGVVTADGIPLTDIAPASWRERIAWAPQDAYVFDSTIRANLLLARGRDDAPSAEDMEAVLVRAGLGPLLAELPDGLDTRVGAGGSALSGGERQRLAVARAILTRADVILLDEPTAHLDAPTAHAMMADMRAATDDRIVLLVSHREDDRALAGSARISL
ncbi:thiol reductant ABC exporter subunit CydC [Microbacterium indicum]|uniref:thiol reductant ABC exporter subunit CydC n=1 Tax=Microbacterium indicum TaxID=358100 RepID=UPI00041CB63C|nr:thiol reductant ABC exporter subunit CydC [Microbacterium indicum]